ncbi:MAG: hypothetical protein QHJ73_11995, partial [Armatimonadota bacterium]|nr:hypothetical protein [Armatimonadota bacterium]
PMPESHPTYKDVFAGNRAERNILVCTAPETYAYRFTSAPSHLPVLRGNLIWAGGGEPVFVKQGNIGVRGLEAWCRWSGEKEARVEDPRLAGEAGDFLPGPDSPAWALGFERIPTEQIGCYAAAERVTWPLRPGRDRFREVPVCYTVPGYVPPKERPPLVHFLGPVREDFEGERVGAPPRRGDVMAPDPSRVVVTDEIAASGRQCLKVIDAPRLPYDWLPRLFYATDFHAGWVVVALDLRLDGTQPPSLYLDLRQYGSGSATGYHSGPMLVVRPDGALVAGDEMLAKLPMDRWVHLELRVRLGTGAPAESPLVVRVEGAQEQHLRATHRDRGFQRLDRVVIASTSTRTSVFWIDNVRIEPIE